MAGQSRSYMWVLRAAKLGGVPVIDVYMRALEGARYQATHPSTLTKRRSAPPPRVQSISSIVAGCILLPMVWSPPPSTM